MLTGLILLVTAAVSEPPTDLRDLVGARGAGGETQLLARGYIFVGVDTIRGMKLSRWWNAKSRQCVAITTANGRYRTISRMPAIQCGRLKPTTSGRERDRIRAEVDNSR